MIAAQEVFWEAVAQPLWVSWVSGHPEKFKLGCPTPQKVKSQSY